MSIITGAEIMCNAAIKEQQINQADWFLATGRNGSLPLGAGPDRAGNTDEPPSTTYGCS
jgi:hypothetical protein